MRKLYLILLIGSAFLLQLCTAKRQATAKKAPAITYSSSIKGIMTSNCSPCHFPPQGNKKPLDTYAAVKGDIDEILVRIQKNPGERGFMPMRHPKLADSVINQFKVWKETGLAE
jgi:hypothetical protein